MKKGGKAECRKADRLKMGKRSFRSRLRAADKAGGNFRGTGKPAAWLQNRSGSALAEQLSRINEQLAIKNRRAKRVWKAIAFIVGGIIAVYVLILILATVFTFSPDQSDTTDSSQSIESIVEKE